MLSSLVTYSAYCSQKRKRPQAIVLIVLISFQACGATVNMPCCRSRRNGPATLPLTCVR